MSSRNSIAGVTKNMRIRIHDWAACSCYLRIPRRRANPLHHKLLFLVSILLLSRNSSIALVVPVSLLTSHQNNVRRRWRNGACGGARRVLFCATCNLTLYSTAKNGDESELSSSKKFHNNNEVKEILTKYGFGSRIFQLSNDSLSKRPMPSEICENGSWKLCVIVGLKNPSPLSQVASNDIGSDRPPLLEVLVMNNDGVLQDQKVVDVGQVTTVWNDFYETYSISSIKSLMDTLQSAFTSSWRSLQSDILPIEAAMQNLYNNRIANRSRPLSNHNRNTLTKKLIPKIASQSSNPLLVEELLRSLIKVGEDRVSRMVDASLASDYLYKEFCSNTGSQGIIRRMVAAKVLTDDAMSGGRFKRRPCQFVSARYASENGGQIQQVTLLNGGWVAVDPSVKAGTEGRKFASLAEDSVPSASKDSENISNVRIQPRVFTAADERVAHRLECLAMGDVWKEEGYAGENEEQRLELDVREALLRMNLPLNPEGATEALIRIGRWSESERDRSQRKKSTVEPWPPQVLEAARALARYENGRREMLAKKCFSAKSKSADLEGRVNLSLLPCVCIDAKRASFRDDSIGIRLRSSTGRKVHKAASKWEILIHIADVSDLYFHEEKANANVIIPNEDGLNTQVLRQAAERRGQSRYDLPLGPLHLLPPVALEALSLSTNQNKVPNRCVTLWAYIDERNGKLIEAGLERSVISSPLAMSFADATTLLNSGVDEIPSSMTNIKSVLTVADRNLSLWSTRHRQTNKAAEQRENRLATREKIAVELSTSVETERDDGAGGLFQRSRAHRLVDSSLDLYAFALGALMKRANEPIPRAAGSGADRGGRLGTAPLRRYIDGLAQRQALSVLCDYGIPLSPNECREAASAATQASNQITNLQSTKAINGSTKQLSQRNKHQISALHKLNRHLISTGGINNQRQVNAISTGRNNEIVIEGVGATARLNGVGNLVGGEKLLVQVMDIDPEKGWLDVRLA